MEGGIKIKTSMVIVTAEGKQGKKKGDCEKAVAGKRQALGGPGKQVD